MTQILQNWVNVFQMVGSAGTVAVAVLMYIWQRRSTRALSGTTFAEQMRHYNLLILQDEDMLRFEAERHPFGRGKGAAEFSVDDAKKMYMFFILLNIGHAQYIAHRSGALDDRAYHATMGNSANMTYPDRDFIRTHCFPRGYTPEFRKEYEKRWTLQESNGGAPPAIGAA
jgi:hypothetical protein